jgi:hypothetical protein
MSKSRPPLAIEVLDFLNLARLIMGTADIRSLLWLFKHRNRLILGKSPVHTILARRSTNLRIHAGFGGGAERVLRSIYEYRAREVFLT